MEYKNKQQIVNYIGIGILLFISINTLSSLFDNIIEKTLFYNKLNFNLIFWTKEVCAIGIYTFLTFIFLKYIKNKELNNNRDFRKIFTTLIIVFLTSSVLLLLIPLLMSLSFLMISILPEQSKYYSKTLESNTYVLLPSILTYLKYAIVLKISIKKINVGQ